MKKSIVILFLFLSAYLFASPSSEVRDSGEKARIVSLSPNITETIFALGGEDEIVGRTDYCNYPAEAEEVPSVGSIWSPSLETIVSLRPTLVIASSLVDAKVVTSIEKAGIRTVTLNYQETFEGTYDFINQVGGLIDRETEAEELVKAMRRKAEEVRRRYGDADKPTVYVAVSWGEFDSAATGDTFISDMVTLAGGVNVASAARGWLFSKEELVSAEPEVVILMNAEGESCEGAIARWKESKPYGDLKARVLAIDSDLVTRQGPRSADVLSLIADLIHEKPN